MKILFGVDANRVVRTFADVDVDAVLEQPELFEALDLLELSRR